MSYEYGQFSTSHLRKVSKGIQLYNVRKYWECHEELEDHWLEDRGDNARYVYWVVIQAATALFHFEDGNLAGATGMINKAKEKVLSCEAKKVETDIVYKFLAWKKFKSIIMNIPDKPSLENFEELHKFKFSNPDKWGKHIGEE
jgi:hypothetical protein